MKKTCTLLLVMIMLFSMAIPASAAVLPFADVPSESWYAPYVQYVYDNSLMNGTSETVFSPDANMTRGMVVTVLYRIAGSPAVSGGNPFTDVAANSWYATPIIWASETGITSGVTATTFAPDSDVTREQLVSFIYRYCNYYHGTGIIIGELNEFEDAHMISTWAKNALHWAVELGIITGVTDTTLVPQGNATRAQCAAILKRYAQWENAVTGDTTPSEPIVPPQPDNSVDIPESDPYGEFYILNTNSHKFHYPDCRSAAKISSNNYAEFTGSRETLIASGFDPCGNCDP